MTLMILLKNFMRVLLIILNDSNILFWNKFMNKKINKQKLVIKRLYDICSKNSNYIFNNELVKDISKEIGFGNPFTATKIDNKDMLPKELLDKNIGIIHLGNGKHKFIKGIDKIYHNFEEIKENIDWKYKKSLLNKFNSSESNMLSIANNQRILHNFAFDVDKEFTNIDIDNRPKTYFPHRTKTSLDYKLGNENIIANKIQIEIDLTIEYNGTIAIFEAKNKNINNFIIYQIYHPFLYYYNAKESKLLNGKIKDIICIYVNSEEINNITYMKLWKYTFLNPKKIDSIKLLNSRCYKLVN